LRARALLAGALVCLTGLAGCSGSGSDHRTLRIVYAAFPDSLDPATALSAEAWGAMQNTYLPLLTYAHADGVAGTKLIPALAERLPRIADGGRRYELTLRHGLRYSDGKPVRASDFRFSIERLFRLNSPGSPFYTDIVGAERFERTHRGGIPGIRTDDRTGRIVIRLTHPRGTFSYELALLYTALLPTGTPDSVQTRTPPPATGPYEIDSVRPGRSWSYVRNPAWAAHNSAAMPDLPSGHVASIEARVVPNPSTEVNEVEQNRVDWMKGPPPPDRLPELRRRYTGTQFRSEPTISNFYFWMNTRRAPFDDVGVRRAVNYAIDRNALRRIYAGTVQPTEQILPPELPGYRRFAPYPHDLAKAKRMVARADPSDRRVTVWTINLPPAEEAAEYYAQVLQQIGLDAKLKAVDPTDYFNVIGNEKTPDLDTGWGNWLLDYPHPNDYFGPQLSGESIVPTASTNWARFDDPPVTAEIRRLAAQQLGPRRVAAYAKLDREVTLQAPWAAFGNLTLSTFVSSEIDLERVIFSPIFAQDLSSFQFK
jgi:peptide/nickel transport system substrate-binding protein